MKSPLGRAASRSYATREQASYEQVSAEYYDDRLHPTCRDFRAASHTFLEKLFSKERPSGRIADVGCGRSIVSEFVQEGLVLVDASPSMLRLNSDRHELRLVDISESRFGNSEFDWVFAILGDPFNELEAWQNISAALKPSGRCVFIVPSVLWATRFRESSKSELPGKARFDLSSGRAVFLPSVILSPAEQASLAVMAELRVDQVEQVCVNEIANVQSPKISKVLNGNDPLLDIYRISKTVR